MLNVRIRNKRDTNNNFEQNDPVLLNGEIVVVDHETDGMKIKIGDGINRYSSLPYFNPLYSEKPVYTYSEIQGLDEVISNLEAKIQLIPIIPSGVIMMWSGLETDIPDGYVLCNGQNGTPDLTDKFVIGAGSTYAVGETGGESAHVLTIDEMPSHGHNGTTQQAGNHNHRIGTDKDASYAYYGDCWSVHNSSTGAAYYNGSTSSDGDHTHSFTTNNIGGNQAHNNMPPYYALCFIMKI